MNKMTILILLFSIFYFIHAYRRLDWAVMFLIAALPSYLIRFSIFGLPATLLELMIWLVFLAWFLKNYIYIIENLKLKIGYLLKIKNCKLKINNRYPFDWEIILLLVISFIAVGISGFSSSALGIWKAYFFEPVLLYIVILNVFKPLADNTLNATEIENTKQKNIVRMTRIPHPTLSPPIWRAGLLRRGGGVEKIVWALAISAFAVAVLAIYQKVTGQFIDNVLWQAAATRRVVSFFGYPNSVGLYLGPVVLVMLGWFLNVILERLKGATRLRCELASGQVGSRRDSTRFAIASARRVGRWSSLQNDKVKIVFIGLTIIISVLAIYFAKSKGALAGAAAGLVVFGLLAGRKVRWATILTILIAGIAVFAYAPTRNSLVKTVTFNTLSGKIRQVGWSDSWKMLKDGRLITGAGLANYQTAIKPYHTEGIFIKNNDPDWLKKVWTDAEYRKKAWQPLEIYLYPHNIFLNFWSELGLAGLLLFVWMILKYFWLGIYNFPLGLSSGRRQFIISKQTQDYKSQKYLVIGLIGAMTVIVVHGLVDAPYFKNDLAVMFWLFIAMVGIIDMERKQKKIKSPV